MADERRSGREAASALGALVAGVETALEGTLPEPDVVDTETPEITDVVDTLDESDTVEAVADDEEMDLDTDAEPEDDAESTFMTLIVNGTEHPKTQSEVQMLAQKGLYFDQNQQALTAEKRDWERQKADYDAQLMAERQEYATVLPILRQQVEAMMGPEPDWVQLAQQVSPQEYNQARANYEMMRDKMNAATSEQHRMQGLIQQQYEAQAQRWREEQADLTVQRIPEWQDDKARSDEKSAIQSYALGLGITAEEFDQIHDARFWEILRDAYYGRQAKSAKTKEVPRRETKAVQPGSGKQKTSRSRRRQRQRDRARQMGGKVSDIAPLMADIFESREQQRKRS